MTELTPVIAVDGPSGTGKGTVCQRLAAWLGWHYLDSGALYRVVGHAASQRGIPLDDARKLAKLAANLDLRFEYKASSESGEVSVFLDGRDVAPMLRTEEAGRAASQVAAIPQVRAALLGRQRAFLQVPGLIADGRDMGTVVFPDARLKIFLTASAEERARRRYNQLKQKGIDVSLRALFQDISERDERDRTRAVSPLIPAVGAVVMDTTTMGIDAVYKAAQQLVIEKGLYQVSSQV